jgi:antitoxin component of MazEF toxin-antitoxin module
MPARVMLGVLTLAAPLARDDAFPFYAVQPGAEIVRVWTTSTKLASEPARLFVDGEELPTKAQGEMRLRVEDRKRFEVVDTIAAVEDGRPTKFEREYRAFENSGTEVVVAKPAEGEERERESERKRTTPLAEQVVRFTWNAKDEEYAAAFVVAEGAEKPDADLLLDLGADVDWLPLLVDGPREKGARFEIDTKLVQRFQNPLGDLHWLVDGKEPDATAKEINAELAESLAGTVAATWQGVREEDGRSMGIFEFEAEVSARAEADVEDTGETRVVEVESTLEGELRWDMAAGRLAGYAIEVDVRSKLVSRRDVEGAQGKAQLEQVFELNGTTQHGLETRAP